MDYTTLLISFACLLNTCSTQTTSTSPPPSTTLQTPTTNPQTSTPPPPTTHSTTDLPVANTTADYSDIISDEIEKLQSSGYLFFPHIYRAFLDAGRRPLFYNSSEDCSRNLETYYNAFIDRKGWAWNIYDATGKQGAGLFTGALTWVGNFHQCINSMGYYFSELTTGEAPPTQFCAVYIATPQWVVNLLQGFNLPFPVQKPPFIADICTVVGCTESDLQNIVQRYVNDVSWSGNYSVTSVKCRTVKKLRNDAGAIVTLCIIALILLLVVLGTTFEIYLRAKRHGIKSSRDILIGEMAPVNSIKSTSSSTTIRGRPRKKSSLTWLAYKNEAFVPDIDITETSLSGASPTEQPSPTTPGLAQITEAQNEDGNKPEENHSDTANGSLLKQEKQSTPENIVTNHVNGTTVPNDETKDENTDPHTQTEYHPTDDHTQTEYHPTDDHDRLPLSDYHPDLPSPNGLKKRSSKDSRKASVFFPRMQHKHLHTQLSVVKDNSTLQGTFHLFEKILVTFSIRRNLTNVLGKGHADTMFCLNGVRVCSIGWIVLGSYYNAIYSNPTLIDNSIEVVKLTQSFWVQAMINTTFAADTFFVLSGTLFAYNFMKQKKGSKNTNMLKVLSPGEYFMSIIHRLARIVPCFYFIVMVYTNLGPYMSDGVDMRYGMKPNTACPDHWWANLLFISNFYKADSMCMPWTYYLVNDLQFSLLAPLVAIPLLCYPVIGFCLVVLLIGVQITSVMVINTGINGSILRMSNTDYFSKVYVKPYCRVGAYAIGLGLGYLLYTGDKKIRLRQIPLYVGWVVCLAVVAILPYITYMENQVGGDRWSGIETSLYEAISRPSWALAVAWVIFTCCNGQGGFISKILTWNFFIPLCRITYGVFLIHPILIEVSLNSGHSNQYVTFGQMTYGYIANFVSCWCLALMFIVIIEQPFTSIEALVRTHLTSKKTR